MSLVFLKSSGKALDTNVISAKWRFTLSQFKRVNPVSASRGLGVYYSRCAELSFSALYEWTSMDMPAMISLAVRPTHTETFRTSKAGPYRMIRVKGGNSLSTPSTTHDANRSELLSYDNPRSSAKMSAAGPAANLLLALLAALAICIGMRAGIFFPPEAID